MAARLELEVPYGAEIQFQEGDGPPHTGVVLKRLVGFLAAVVFIAIQPMKPIPVVPAKPIGQVGVASWYGGIFHGRKTASGKRFNRHGFSCAHRTLPLGSKVRVEVLSNGASMELVVTDRGPYIGNRILDLSEGAANKLGVREQGLALVRVIRVS